MQSTLIPFEDYKRIHNVISSSLYSADLGVFNNCASFSIIASLLLKEHYSINAKPQAGLAGYIVGDEEEHNLMFAEYTEGKLSYSQENFHCWVEADGWIIDFMSPLFPHLLNQNYDGISCKAKMFQKEFTRMVSSPNDLKSFGDFFQFFDPTFTNEIVDIFFEYPINTDVAKACCNWYRKPPEKIKRCIDLFDRNNRPKKFTLKETSIKDSW